MTVADVEKRATLTRRMAREPQGVITSTLPNAGVEELAPAKRQTKAALVSEMLMAEGSASLEQLCQATGWQAHTCRSFLTGLRKNDSRLARGKRNDGVTMYQLHAEGGNSSAPYVTTADEA